MDIPLAPDLIQYALRAYFDDPVVTDTRFFKMGAENTTALLKGNFGSVVLRVWGEKHSRMGSRKLSDIEGELAFMEACRSLRLPIPKVYHSLAGHEFEALPDGRRFAFMDYVEGEEPAHFTQPMIETIATAVAKMDVLGQTFTYPVPRSWEGTIVDLTYERIEEYRLKGTQDAFIEYLIGRLDQEVPKIDLSKLPFGPIHGDVMYQNIKFVGERLSGIFDFDDCRESYLIEDITKTLYFSIEDPTHCVLGNTIANAKVFMRAYERVRPLSEEEKAALPVLSTARFTYELLKFYLHAANRPDAAAIRASKKAAYDTFKPLFEHRFLWDEE